MTGRGPDFDALVGTDLEPAERDRLLRVHEAPRRGWAAAGGRAARSAPSTVEPIRLAAATRRRGALVALAAALGVLVFAVGALVGDAWNEPGRSTRSR